MGRYNNKRNYNNKNKQSKIIYEPQKPVDKDQLVDEAVKAIILLNNCKEKLKKGLEKYCYVISLDWFTDWQEYVGYLDVQNSKDPEGKNFGRKKPGKINSDIIDKDDSEYYKIPEEIPESSYLNCYLSSKFDEKTDAKLVDLDTWNYFSEKYEGIQIRRPVIQITEGKYIYDVEFKIPHIIFLNDQLISDIQDKTENQIKKIQNILNIQYMPIPKYWKLSTLYDLIQRCLQITESDKQLNIRIWKVDGALTKLQLKSGLVKSIQQKTYKIKGEVLDVEFYDKYYMKDYVRNQYYYCIEIKNQDSQWTFSQSEKGLGPFADQKGFCEYCEEEEKLIVSCLCQKVFYCGFSCKYKDQDFHSNLCPIAFDSEGEEELKLIKIEKKGKSGLENIGNTCYMNSALQSLIHCQYFSDFYCQNNYQMYLKDNDKKTHQLTAKVAKMIKQYFIEDQNHIAPHAVKSQISIIHPIFRGKDQHDTCEFINYFISTLDEQLKPFNYIQDQQQEEEQKEGNPQQIDQIQQNKELDPYYIWENQITKAFSPLLINSFLGLFKSYITCPDCAYNSTQYDSFTIFSVPIKFKPLIKGLQIYIVQKDINKPILSHFLEFKQDDDTINTAILELSKIYKLNAAFIQPTIATTEGIEKFYDQEKSLNIKLDSIEKDISKTNKYFVLYELSDILQQNEKLIQITFQQCQPLPGTKDYTQNVNVSIPRILVISEYTPIASIYCYVLSLFQNEYADAMKFVEEEINKQDDNEEQKQQHNQKDSQQSQDKQDKDSNKKDKQNSKNKQEEESKQEEMKEDQNEQIYVNLPFKINIVSDKKKKKKGKGGQCHFCNKNCDNCRLPFDKTKTYQEFITNYEGKFSLEIFWDKDKQIPKFIKNSSDFSYQGMDEGADNKKKDFKKSNCPSISECLEHFSEPEELSQDNMWYCQQCNKPQQAFKSLQVFFAPKYLILQIKRFRTDEKGNKQKNSQQVLYDEQLDFSNMCKLKSPQIKPNKDNDKITYSLYAIIIHEGSLDNGHYYAYCKEGQEWYEFNDDKVNIITKDKVLDNKGAYILFYAMNE